MLDRIHLFCSEVLDHPKVVHQLVEWFNNVINDDMTIEELHTSNRSSDDWFIKNRFSETEQVKIVLEYSSAENERKQDSFNPFAGSFLQSMSQYENQDPFIKLEEGLVKKNVMSEELKKYDDFYKKMRSITIVVPTDMTLSRLAKFITEKITNYDQLETHYMKKNRNIYVESHSYRGVPLGKPRNQSRPILNSSSNKFYKGLDLFETFTGSKKVNNINRNQDANMFNAGFQTSQANQEQNISKLVNVESKPTKKFIKEEFDMKIADIKLPEFVDEIGFESSSDKFELFPSIPLDSSPKPQLIAPVKNSQKNIIAELKSLNGQGVDMRTTVSSWIKQNIKRLRSKNKQTFGGYYGRSRQRDSNMLRFTIKEVDKEDIKEGEDSEEDIMFDEDWPRKSTKADVKFNRSYSLFLQKDKTDRSLYKREIQRLVEKDLRSPEMIRDELDDSCQILELMKFILLLHQKNVRDFLKINGDNSSRFTKSIMNQSKLKSVLANTRIDGLLKSYLLTKHHSENIYKKDEILTEIVQHFPMIYSFRTRVLFFKLSAFDHARNRYFASELVARSIPKSEGGIMISRRKIEISRERILEKGLSKLKDLQQDRSFLEFQFENEVGTGLGPTLEFYALIGQAIKEEPNMWKETTDNTLYPNPLNLKKKSAKQKRQIEKFFELVGTIVARSIMDERLIDLPISPVFWKLVFSETTVLEDIEKIDKMFYKGLKMIQDLWLKKESKPQEKEIGTANPDWECDWEKQQKQEVNVEDLWLTFTLPGTENIELVRNGAKKSVTESNMGEYLRSTLNSFF